MKYLYQVCHIPGINLLPILKLLKGELNPTTETMIQVDTIQRGGEVMILSSTTPTQLEEMGYEFNYTLMDNTTPEETRTEKVKELQKKLEEAVSLALEIKDYTVVSQISNVLSIL